MLIRMEKKFDHREKMETISHHRGFRIGKVGVKEEERRAFRKRKDLKGVYGKEQFRAKIEMNKRKTRQKMRVKSGLQDKPERDTQLA